MRIEEQVEEQVLQNNERENKREKVSLKKHTPKHTPKHTIVATVCEVKQNKILLPEIVLCLCLPKKTACEDAFYSSAQMGVKNIKLLVSQKTQRKWGGPKETERLHNILRAGCEQSKQFIVPEISDPVAFTKAIDELNQDTCTSDSVCDNTCHATCSCQHVKKIYFDMHGQDILKLLNELSQNQTRKAHDKARVQKIIILVGPEGGLSQEEKTLLEKHGFCPYKLTPTILRVQDAVLAGLASIRSA